MKQLFGWVVFLGVVGCLIFATGFHKTLYSLVTGEPTKDVKATSYGVMVR